MDARTPIVTVLVDGKEVAKIEREDLGLGAPAGQRADRRVRSGQLLAGGGGVLLYRRRALLLPDHEVSARCRRIELADHRGR